jgi:hypothetical protein
MAVTQEFIEQVAEALNVLGDALEASDGSPRGVEIISDEGQIDSTLSLPGVVYDGDPITDEEARAVKYVQIPWSILSSLLTTLRTQVAAAEEAVSGATDILDGLSNPPYVADGTEQYPGDIGYVYQWDNVSKQYVKGQKIGDTPVVVATDETCRSIVSELV